MFFSSWSILIRILIVGILAYIGLVFLLIISGKRTLSKMNAFDLVVTVALGSTLASTLLSRTVALADGLLAFFTLIYLQYLVAWASVRWKAFSRLVKTEPRMLVYQSELLTRAMKEERVVKEEILQAIRQSGFASIKDVEAVVLETDGTFSVMGKTREEKSSLQDVKRSED